MTSLFHQVDGESSPTRPKTSGYFNPAYAVTRPPSELPPSRSGATSGRVRSIPSIAGFSSVTSIWR